MPRLPRKAPAMLVRPDARVRLVDGRDLDVDVVAEHAALFAFERQSVQHGQRVRGNGRAQPLDDVAVVVVVRRLDENQREAFRCLLHSH